MRTALALIPLFAIAACGGDDGATGNAAAPVTAAPAADVKPPEGKSWVDVVAKTPEGGFVQGNPNAAVKLVEYGSRGCPTCGRFAMEGVEPLREKYISTGKVSYEFRDFLVHGASDFAAALLNQCVPLENFFPVLDALMINQEKFMERLMKLQQSNPQALQELQALQPAQQAARIAEYGGYIEFMKQQGLPEDKARACLADQKTIESIAKTNADAVNVYNAQGTPTFFINGKVVANASTWDKLEPALQAAGAR